MTDGPAPSTGAPATPATAAPRDGDTGARRAARPGADVRLVASDLDGTLLRPDGTVAPRTAAALADAEKAGLDVVFVTARPHRWLADLAAHVAGHGVAICANGASVVDVAGLRVLEQHGMGRDRVAAVAARLRAAWGADAVHLAVEGADGFAAERGFFSEHPVPDGSPRAERIEDVLPVVTLKLLLRATGRAQDADAFVADAQQAVGDLAHVTSSAAGALGEIAAPGVTKAATLAEWSARRGIAPAQVWAVGDAPNDLPMLRWAGRAFAVANAHPAVRAAADTVLPSNADDGVAVLLERAAAAARARSQRTSRPGSVVST
ncbi:HAD family hydrolase [Cellulomonas wangsupingiae]|uniref:HAD family hydrolase n=1 Tax=Cellulomonas wangsupingiae TaxID=2968085 RepID=UPI001D0ECDF5|nr:HAD-IIB family hydrolase [Cellulomonas wangsupingiae]MCM0640100.1 HAD-IIB family hydrolase [Cellulomonas wangsupingiae]